MKIAVFTTQRLNNGNQGNQQDIKNRIKIFLKAGFNVILIILNKDGKEEENIFQDKEFKNINITLKGQLAGKDNINRCEEVIKENDPDILWFEYSKLSKLAQILKNGFPEKKIYFRAHNYELGHFTEKTWDNLKTDKFRNVFKNILSFLINYRKIKKLEDIMFRIADKIFFISKLDMKKYEKRFKDGDYIYLPFYADFKKKHKPQEKKMINVFYMGSNFSNNINYRGYINLKKIANVLIDRQDIKFHIIGKNLKDGNILPNIEYHDYIKDLNIFLEKMDVGIIPINIGYGMKIKVYESIKRGFPTIMMSRNHYVFQGTDGVTYKVCNKTGYFKKAIINLKDYEKRLVLSKGAKIFSDEFLNMKTVEDTIKKNI